MADAKIVQQGGMVFWLVIVFVAAIVGFTIGASISHPLLLAKPTRDLLTQTNSLDRVVLGELHDPRDVTDDLHKLKATAAELPNGAGDKIGTSIDLISSKLTEQTNRFQENLWKAHDAVSVVRDQVKLQAEATSGIASIIYDQLRRFLKWTGPVLALGGLILAFAATNPVVRGWLARATTVGVGPLSIAVGDVVALKQSIRQHMEEVDGAIVTTYKDKSEKFDLEGLFARLKIEIDQQIKKAFAVDMKNIQHRSTMYVPSFTGEQLVQVTKYAPPYIPEKPVVGRHFSARYRIIGRAFRLRTALYNWDVNNKQNNLVRLWGLTRAEAYKQGGRATSLMAFPIPPDQSSEPLAIVYLEASGTNQLMPGHSLEDLAASTPNDPDGRSQADVLANDRVWKPLWDDKLVQPLYEALLAMKAEFNWDVPLQGRDGQ